jgi:hypothetical protein
MRKLLRQKYTWQKAALAIALSISFGCSDENIVSPPSALHPLLLNGQILHENVTRANDYGFVTGDRMGIYVVDRINSEAGDLDASGNRASNVLYTYDGDTYQWAAPTPIYWRDRQTPVDIYGYYPGVNYIEQPTAYHFSVQTDQSTEAANGELSGYEQSDLLWGKTANISYTQEQIVVKYRHVLAGIRVQLLKGEGVNDAEWQKLEKTVMVVNTTTEATVNLSTGSVTPKGTATSPVRMALQSGDQYRAVVIPQQVAAGRQLVSITLDGQTYSHSLASVMNYEGGKLHNFTLTVNKREAAGDYDVSLAYDGIMPWTNDETSHQFAANAYVVVHCPEPEKLEESIRQAGYDPQTLKNMKVTGTINYWDIYFMNRMPQLAHLNLKDVVIKELGEGYLGTRDNFLTGSFGKNGDLRSIVLPSRLKGIGDYALSGVKLMNSTLEIPEGVTYIGRSALSGGVDSRVTLILPNSLDTIGDDAFSDCPYQCELKLPESLTYIGDGAFNDAENFYGTFHFPSQLKHLGSRAFWGMGRNKDLTGEIEIPQGMTVIPADFCPQLKNRVKIVIPEGVREIGDGAFRGLSVSALALPQSLAVIGESAFSNSNMPFAIAIPENVTVIEDYAFSDCGIEGELVIPENCVHLGAYSFCGNHITKLVLPSKIEKIGMGAFFGNEALTEITLPKYVEEIGSEAFSIPYLQTVVCLNPEPPKLLTNPDGHPFEGVAFDKCILQVPEESIEAYRHAEGWNLFQSITPYRELAVNITEMTTLDKGLRREGIIRAQGAWEVTECPSWCSVEPMSGSGKAEVAITVKPQPKSAPDREGRVAFSLKGKDFTIYVPVRQLSYEYGEDETIILQQASAGAPKAVPLFIVGDGYNADDIQSGKYLADMKEQMEHLFSCEPFKTYRNYFTVSTAIAVSPESGIPTFYGSPTKDKTRFGTELTPDGFLGIDWQVWNYAQQHGVDLSNEREGEATIMVLLNSHAQAAMTYLEDNGRSISYIGKSTDAYPYDQRGFVLREVGGIGFGKLASEDVVHFTFAKTCPYQGCLNWFCYWNYKARGWYENITSLGKRGEVPWSHLIYHPKYAPYVDVYEGAYRHARGFYRSEPQSVMSNYIPYFNTISRESIVRRIMQYAGESYSFDKFVEKDKIEIPE